jgi:hypothetical protein
VSRARKDPASGALVDRRTESGIHVRIVTRPSFTNNEALECPGQGTLLHVVAVASTARARRALLACFASAIGMPRVSSAQLDSRGGLVTFRRCLTKAEASRIYLAEHHR